MKKLLEQKMACITGASKGIGNATAQLFAQHGADLILVGKREQALLSLKASLERDYAIQAHVIVIDVSDADSIKQGIRTLYGITKSVDVLVNNAGILDDALIGMVTPSQVEKTFQTNTYSVLYFTQYIARLMMKMKQGSIINISSIIGKTGNSGQTVYGGSKAAVLGATKSSAKELAPYNIRVNAITPGFIDTPMTKQLPQHIYEERVESVAMARAGEADEVAQVILFLASHLSSYVTGQVIGVDGGMVI